MRANERRPAGAASEVIAATKIIVPQTTDTTKEAGAAPFDRRRLHDRRAIIRDLAWTSEHRSEPARAARLCRRCPLLDICAQYADEIAPSWGIWAGIDRSPSHSEPTGRHQ